jgi:hypothetical protein
MTRLLLVVGIILSTSCSAARSIELEDLVGRVRERIVKVDQGMGYVVQSDDQGNVLIATVLHNIKEKFEHGGVGAIEIAAVTPLQGCGAKIVPKAVHWPSGGEGNLAPDLALIVGLASCARELRDVPSAWIIERPSPGSAFYTFAFLPGVSDGLERRGPVYFADGCLPDDCIKDNQRLVMQNFGDDPGMSGAPVLTKDGVAGILFGDGRAYITPVIEALASLCGSGEAGASNVSGFLCAKAPADARAVPATLLAENLTTVAHPAKCDPRVGKELRDNSEIGRAYACRLDRLEVLWRERAAGLNCLEWANCRDTWFATVGEAGFPLGFSPPPDWGLLLQLLDMHGYPVELVLSNPDKIQEFRKLFVGKGFGTFEPETVPATDLGGPPPSCTIARAWPTVTHAGAEPGDLLANKMAVSGDMIATSVDYGPLEATRTKYLIWKYSAGQMQLLTERMSPDPATVWLSTPALNSAHMFVLAGAVSDTVQTELSSNDGSILSIGLTSGNAPPAIFQKVDIRATLNLQRGWLAYIPKGRGTTAMLWKVGETATVEASVNLAEIAGRSIGGTLVSFDGEYLAIFSYDLGTGLGDRIDIFKRTGDQWQLDAEITVPSDDRVWAIDLRAGRLAILGEHGDHAFLGVAEENYRWQYPARLTIDANDKRDSETRADYATPEVVLGPDFVVIGDPKWSEVDDWTEEKMGALHVLRLPLSAKSTVIDVIQPERKGWDTLGDSVFTVDTMIVASGTHGVANNTGEVLLIDTGLLKGQVSCP